jgi:iron(III) transport system ATP-binding protein
MIRVKELQKSFAGARGEVRALRGVSFEVGKGELFTLLGPSGCGKTTTLRCIAGLEQPWSGEILIDDHPVFSAAGGVFVPPERRNIGMVFQSYAIWPHMTVFQNVAYPLAREAGRAEIGERVARILDRLGLGSLADRLAPNLSGGNTAQLARALRRSRRCCCWTSRSAISTPSCANRCVSSSRRCRSLSALRPCT